MNTIQGSVVVSHPGKQHSYQVALAFQRAGMLKQFITGIYYKPNQFPYSIVRYLPSLAKKLVLRELKKRQLILLHDGLITSVPYCEAFFRIFGGLPPLKQITDGRPGFQFANWAGDKYVRWWLSQYYSQPAILYCFLGAALSSLRYAKRMGILTVLDVPTLLNTNSLIAIERLQLGFPTKESDLDARLKAEVLEADYIIAPSDEVVKTITAFGVPSKRILLIPFGVDINNFSFQDKVKPKTDQKFRVLFVGKIDIHKGVHYLLEAWNTLALPDAELIIVGPSNNPDYKRYIHRRYGKCYHEYGNVPHYEIPGLYARADIFVFPSLAEGSALVTYEALASGLPCVVTHEAGSVVRDGIEGYVIPSRDVGSLIKCIKQLYDNPELRISMANAARRRASEFTWEKYGERLVNNISMISSHSI